MLRDAGDRLDFSHVRIQEVAYESTPPARRRVLHGVIARAIEAVDPTAVAEHAHVLARHWREAGNLDRAAALLLVAGRRAIMQAAARHAMEHYEEGLALLATLPETSERLALGLQLRLHASNAHIPLGHVTVVARYAVETEALATKLGDEPRLGVAHLLASRSALMSGDASEMLRRAEAALAIGRRLDEPRKRSPRPNARRPRPVIAAKPGSKRGRTGSVAPRSRWPAILPPRSRSAGRRRWRSTSACDRSCRAAARVARAGPPGPDTRRPPAPRRARGECRALRAPSRWRRGRRAPSAR